MPFRTLNRLAGAAAVLAVLVSASGCSHKRPPALANAQPGEAGSEASSTDRRAPEEPISEGPDVRGLESDRTTGADLAGGGLAGEGGPLADIHFDLDSAVLTDAARGTLEKHTATSAAPSSTTSRSGSSARARRASTWSASASPPLACVSSHTARSACSTRATTRPPTRRTDERISRFASGPSRSVRVVRDGTLSGPVRCWGRGSPMTVLEGDRSGLGWWLSKDRS
jgi:hypothetical protein